MENKMKDMMNDQNTENLNVPADTMILGKDSYYDLDTYKTQRNNNVVVIGSPGSGKTRGIVIPNLLQCSGSYVITDPKGNLYHRYKNYLSMRGYNVKLLDFYNPRESVGYNCIRQASTDDDIAKLAHLIIYSNHKAQRNVDPFWDEAAELLLTALLAYLKPDSESEMVTFKTLAELMNLCDISEYDVAVKNPLDMLFDDIAACEPESYAVRKYRSFRQAAEKTMKSILITMQSTIARYDCNSVTEVMKRGDLHIPSIGNQKTALFITVSDTDRRLDGLINIVFSQIMQELVRYADCECKDQHLPIPVRFLMDDFATNVVISDFPRMIASIRSRWISTMMILQAESQLMEQYGYDGETILGSCDTYVYLGGEDIKTAQNVALRADKSLRSVLEMPVGTQFIFRRGERMVTTSTFPMTDFESKCFEEARKLPMNRLDCPWPMLEECRM